MGQHGVDPAALAHHVERIALENQDTAQRRPPGGSASDLLPGAPDRGDASLRLRSAPDTPPESLDRHEELVEADVGQRQLLG